MVNTIPAASQLSEVSTTAPGITLTQVASHKLQGLFKLSCKGIATIVSRPNYQSDCLIVRFCKVLKLRYMNMEQHDAEDLS